ncbi:MAG: NAD(P)/FAD-dependent oxidoreductase [Gemmatimonadales bacterium]
MNEAPVWDDGDWMPLPALHDHVDADVCVIGLGGSGLAAVLELLAMNQRVVGLDSGSVGGGAAGRNGGFLLAGTSSFYHRAAAQFGREAVHAVYLRTMVELDRMTAETPHAIRRSGSLRIAGDAAELLDCNAQLDMMRADGLPAEPYDGPEGRGILVPTDGACNPLLRCRLLARQALLAGATLFERSTAVGIRGDLVRTARGTVHCSRVIVAVDGRLERVLPELAPRVRTARLQMLATAPDVCIELPRPVYQRWGYDYWQQLPDHRMVLGGLRDRAGDGEWTDLAVTTESIQRALEQVLRQQIGATAPITHRWAGVVGYSASGLPIIGEFRPQVWAVGGYNGTGNILGAVCGRGAAELAVRGQSGLLTGLLSPA